VEHESTQARLVAVHDESVGDAAAHVAPVARSLQSLVLAHDFVQAPHTHWRPVGQSVSAAHVSSQFELLPD
jgi:ethanolamine ammonia-lyase large subunit